MKNEEKEKKLSENFSGIFLGVIIGFIIGFLLKEKDKEKLIAFLKEKMGQLGEEVKEKAVELPEKTKPVKRFLKKRFFVRKRT